MRKPKNLHFINFTQSNYATQLMSKYLNEMFDMNSAKKYKFFSISIIITILFLFYEAIVKI